MVTRKAPGKEVWEPHAYQTRAVGFLMTRNNAALFLDPGLGKTSATLAAFIGLKEKKLARKMLVIAPKRVCYLVWRQEGARWAQFNDLTFGLLHGTKKVDTLAEDHDVYLINPEGIPWLVKQFASTTEFAAKFDTITIDELTKFKNPTSKRWKAFYPYASKCTRRWGLTGTPAPNGLEDLFGQVKMLDDGNALGKYITRFRDMYFVPGFDGYSFKPRQDADARIQARLKNLALRMKAEDYLELPEFIDDIRKIELEPKARKQYEQMKRDMVADLEGGSITADNVAGVYSKLKQMAGGAVYRVQKDGTRVWERIHDAKLDALEELVEELNGQPLLVAYEFNHELERILERFGPIPYLGKGTSDADAVEIEHAWNANEIKILPVHPASSGHGLNLQRGSAHHICWFNPTWDFELYDQLVRRLYRQGSKAEAIFNHILAVDKSIDYLVLDAIRAKDTTQARLVQGLGEILGTKTQSETKETPTMVDKLKPSGWGIRKAAAETAEAETGANRPNGWGAAKGGWGAKKAETGDTTGDTNEGQYGDRVNTEEMAEKLTKADPVIDEVVAETKPKRAKRGARSPTVPGAKVEKVEEPIDETETERVPPTVINKLPERLGTGTNSQPGRGASEYESVYSVTFRGPDATFTVWGNDKMAVLDRLTDLANNVS